MLTRDVIGLALVGIVAAPSAFVLIRFRDFRREFLAYWHPDAVGRRMQAWANRRRLS